MKKLVYLSAFALLFSTAGFSSIEAENPEVDVTVLQKKTVTLDCGNGTSVSGTADTFQKAAEIAGAGCDAATS